MRFLTIYSYLKEVTSGDRVTKKEVLATVPPFWLGNDSSRM